MSPPNTQGADGTPLDGRTGSAVGMCLGERAHREAFQWDAFSLSEDPGVRGLLRRAYKEGFMRGFNTCADLSPNAAVSDGSQPFDPRPGSERKP